MNFVHDALCRCLYLRPSCPSGSPRLRYLPFLLHSGCDVPENDLVISLKFVDFIVLLLYNIMDFETGLETMRPIVSGRVSEKQRRRFTTYEIPRQNPIFI